MVGIYDDKIQAGNCNTVRAPLVSSFIVLFYDAME
jgi:hypothetical protein